MNSFKYISNKNSKLLNLNLFLILSLFLIALLPFSTSEAPEPDTLQTVERTASTDNFCVSEIITETEEICYTDYCVDFDSYSDEELETLGLTEEDRIYCVDLRDHFCRNNIVSKTVNTCNSQLYSGRMNYLKNGSYVPINTTITPSSTSYDYEMITAPYKAYFQNTLNTGEAVKFEKDGYYFIYDLSGGKMQWVEQPGNPTKTKSIGSVLTSTASILNDKVYYNDSFLNTDVYYEVFNEMLKEHFILKDLTINPDYLYLEYIGEVRFSPELDIYANGENQTKKEFQTSGKIEFKDLEGNTQFYLPAPTATMANGTVEYGYYNVKPNDDKLTFGLRVNKTFLETAIFPVDIDPTIKLQDADTENLGDINAIDENDDYYGEIQHKWNLSVPISRLIDDATICYHYNGHDGGSPASVTIERVDDQIWEESISTATYNSQSLDNSDSQSFFGCGDPMTIDAWCCLNVTKAITADYEDSHSNTSFRITSSTYNPGTIDAIDVDVGLWFGDLMGNHWTKFEDRENSGDTGNIPYLNITYSYNLSNITISDCTVLDQANGHYYLDSDITDSSTSNCMDITANNVTLDCQGHTIDGNNVADYGINIENVVGITIKNCTVTDWDTKAIRLDNANRSTFENLNVSSNTDMGIYLLGSSDNTFLDSFMNENGLDGLNIFASSNNNNATNITCNNNNQVGIHIHTSSNSNNIYNSTFNSNSLYGYYNVNAENNYFENVEIINNTQYDVNVFHGGSDYCNDKFVNVTGTDNKPILYYNTSMTIQDWNNNVSQIILCNADNSLIDNLTLDHTDKENSGLILLWTDNSNITNSDFSDLYDGIHLYSSDSNVITNITLNSNTHVGLSLNGVDNTVINNISISNHINLYGIYITNSNYNFINNSEIYSNGYGVWFDYVGSDYNTIANSKIENSTSHPILLYVSGPTQGVKYNNFYNNFFNNTKDIQWDIGGEDMINYWNTSKQIGTRIYSEGHQIGGNFYAYPNGTGYSEICDDEDADGFCDTPYNITPEGKNTDYLPLSSNYASITVSLDSPADNYYSSSSSVTFTCSATSNNYLTNISLYHNLSGTWKLNQTSDITDQLTNSSSFSVIGATDGTYTWNCLAYDNQSRSDWNTNRTLTVDITYPDVNYTSPTPPNGSRRISNSETINISYYDLNFETCILQWQGTNETFANSNTVNFWETKATTDSTTYSFQVFCNDSAGNINDTELRTFRENAKPTLDSVSINDSSPEVSADLECINGTTADSDNDTVSFTYEWFNNSIAQGINNSVLKAGNTTQNDTWYCSMMPQDGYEDGTIKYSSTVSINSTYESPVVTNTNATTALSNINSTSTFPTNNNSWVNLSVVFTDANAGETFTIYFCNVTSLASCKAGNYFCKSGSISDKTFSCRYDVGNETSTTLTYYPQIEDSESLSSGSSTSNTFEINYPPLTPNGTYPANESFIKTNYTFINFSGSDPDSDTINYSVWGGTDQTNLSLIYNGTNAYFNWTGLSDNIQYWRLKVTDQHGYDSFENSSIYSFTIDTINPNVTITEPSSSTTTSTSVYLNFTSDDTNLNTCFYYVTYKDTNAQYYPTSGNQTTACNTRTTLTLNVYSGGYTIYAFANDSATNVGSDSFNITVSIVPLTPGGGVPREKEIIVITTENKTEEQILEESCGDGICQDWESFFNCRLDCPFNIDTLFSGENFAQFWFVQLLFFIVLVVILFVSYKSTQLK